jgi:hypothetical protein
LEIRNANWNPDEDSYDKSYINGLILSNTCDMSFDNSRSINPKECLFAPVLNLQDYLDDLLAAGHPEQKVSAFKNNLITQVYSNLFYLPKINDSDIERIALLDRIFWYPIEQLKPLLQNIKKERIASLNQFGFYPLVLKLSYHFCRLPEQIDRVA